MKDVPLYFERSVYNKMKSRDYSMIAYYARTHGMKMIEM